MPWFIVGFALNSVENTTTTVVTAVIGIEHAHHSLNGNPPSGISCCLIYASKQLVQLPPYHEFEKAKRSPFFSLLYIFGINHHDSVIRNTTTIELIEERRFRGQTKSLMEAIGSYFLCGKSIYWYIYNFFFTYYMANRHNNPTGPVDRQKRTREICTYKWSTSVSHKNILSRVLGPSSMEKQKYKKKTLKIGHFYWWNFFTSSLFCKCLRYWAVGKKQ